ncbi:MAG: glycoside hydrolase family 127 protein [Thermoguttaceae bacterium]
MKFHLSLTFIAAAIVSLFTLGAFAQDVPKRAFREVPFTDVKLRDRFWAPRIRANRLVSIPHNIKWCEDLTGRIRNFKIAAGLETGDFSGIYFDDSDVYKIIEGFAYSLAAHPDPELQKKADEWIDYIAKAQQPDGYLMTYFTIGHQDERWTDLGAMHELYCAGHMAEAAVAYQRATGDDRFVKVNRKLLDLICERYGPNEGQLKNVAGHEEIELALVKMYELTGDRKYLEEAKFFIDTRGVAEGREKGLFGEYCQDLQPVREQTEIVGHAVRAMYLYCGATDVAGYYQDEELMNAMRRIFTNLTRNKMYITGGIGSSRSNEGFEENFKLPNDEAYCETCAAIGFLFWAHRMNLATGEAIFADYMELAAYNGFAAGYNLNGDKYFYVNPLESRGDHHREPFFGCACCPSNVTRALPSMPGYFYAVEASGDEGEDTIVVNMYGSNKATIELADKYVDIGQSTNYPYDNSVYFGTTIRMKDPDAEPTPFFLKMRIPGWLLDWQRFQGDQDKGYTMEKASDVHGMHVHNFPLDVVRMIANPNVEANEGRVALQRGPLVYCFEQIDNPDVRVDRIILAKDPEFEVEWPSPFIQDESTNEETKYDDSRRFAVIRCKDYRGRTLTAVPYCVWDNRAAGRMSVWVRQAGLASGPNSPVANLKWTDFAGDPILYKRLTTNLLDDSVPDFDENFADFSGSFEGDQNSTLDALHQSATPASSADTDVPRATWWGHKGTAEWFEYEFPEARKLSKSTLYWFDDRSINGGCAVPQSWKLTWFDEETDQWVDVATADEYSVDMDKDIVVNFDEITTKKIRIEAQLQEGLSGGILRWVVE